MFPTVCLRRLREPAIRAARHLTTLRWTFLLDVVVALALTWASGAVVEKYAGGSGLVSVAPGRVVPFESIMGDGVRVWWTFTPLLVAGLLIRRFWPVPALALAGVGAAGHHLDLARTYLADRSLGTQPIDAAVLIILFFIAADARTRRRPALAFVLVAVGAYATYAAEIVLHANPPDVPGPVVDRGLWALSAPIPGVFPAMMAILIALLLGEGVRRRRIHLATVRQRAADLEREQRQLAALAVAAERARITRELHDVVAHSLSVIVAQAQAAVAAQLRHPDRTARAMQEVITIGRGSLAEMRRLLGALGSAPVDGDDRAPQPGLEALPALIDRVRATGIPVRFDVRGASVALPAGVDLSAYRIVQEALTNTLKHAGTDARAAVSLAYHTDHVDIEVSDDGAGRHVTATLEHGNGLRGIAERVDLLGGRLTVGPAPHHGFQVRARLPLHPDLAGEPR